MEGDFDFELDESERALAAELDDVKLKLDQVKGSALEQDEDLAIIDESQYLRGPSIVDAESSSIAFRQNRLVDRLWSFCEISSGSAKLILADSLTIPFYMPLPRGPKPKTDKDIAREQARMDYIAQREISARMTTGSNNRAALMTLPDKDAGLSRRERLIGERILYKYRNNDSARQQLFERMEEQAQKHKQAVDELRATRAKHKATATKLTVQERLAQVAKRRQQIIDNENKHNLATEELWKEKLFEKDLTEHSYVELKEQQQMEWLVLIVALKKLNLMRKIVYEVREIKEKDVLRWKSAKKIQKVFRRYIKRLRPPPPTMSPNQSPKLVKKLKTNAANHDHHNLYQLRQTSASLVIKFLRAASGGWKHIIFDYMKKVRLIQRKVRKHLEVNAMKYEFVSNYLDHIFPAIFTHVQVVRSDKGHDLRNMTSMDISRIRLQLRTFRTLHIMKEMDTANFHAFLRRHDVLLNMMSRFFGPSAKKYSMINMEMIKRRVVLDLIFQKRFQLIKRLDSFEPIVIPTMTFSEQDVRNFIQKDIDPLETFLIQMKEEQDLKYQQYTESLKKSKTNRVIKEYKAGENWLLLLHEIKAEDATAVFLRATEIALQQLAINNATTTGNNNPRGASIHHVDKEFDPSANSDANFILGGNSNPSNSSRRNSLQSGSEDQFDANSSWNIPQKRKLSSMNHVHAGLNSSGARSVNFNSSKGLAGSRRMSVAPNRMNSSLNSSLSSSFKPTAPSSLRKSSIMASPRVMNR